MDSEQGAYRMQLVGFCQGEPYGPHTWSGSNRGIFSALRDRDLLIDVFNVEVKGWHRYWAALREYSLDRAVWKQNFMKSPYQFEIRTRNASRYLSQVNPGKPHAVLQIGAMFDAIAAHRSFPRFCYLDSNSALSGKGGKESFSYYAKKKYKNLALSRERDIYHNSAGIFVFSDYVKDSLIQDFNVPEKRIHTIYAGVNITVPPVPIERDKKPIILFVGRDFDRKGGPLLLKAFARVKIRIPAAKLIIAGSSPSVNMPGVEVVGFINKNAKDGENRLLELYKRAAIFTMPSHFEPFGIVYAEAMHFGLPCVGVNHCAMPEIISEGITGLLVEPSNEVELADALVAILENRALSRLMGNEAIKKAGRLFRWEVVAEKMARIIDASREKTWLRAAN
jgi:glycosyltransferase involved in cell wall biosynthesis